MTENDTLGTLNLEVRNKVLYFANIKPFWWHAYLWTIDLAKMESFFLEADEYSACLTWTVCTTSTELVIIKQVRVCAEREVSDKQ